MRGCYLRTMPSVLKYLLLFFYTTGICGSTSFADDSITVLDNCYFFESFLLAFFLFFRAFELSFLFFELSSRFTSTSFLLCGAGVYETLFIFEKSPFIPMNAPLCEFFSRASDIFRSSLFDLSLIPVSASLFFLVFGLGVIRLLTSRASWQSS